MNENIMNELQFDVKLSLHESNKIIGLVNTWTKHYGRDPILESITNELEVQAHKAINRYAESVVRQKKQCIACLKFFKAGTEYYPHTWGPVCPECANRVGLTEVD